MRLLVVEDEAQLARHLLRGLREESYAVDHASSVAEASEQAFAADYDLVILDLMLPGGSGLDLLAEWRREGLEMPVLILTARDAVGDRVAGLDGGADDYLTKPFAFEELLARIRTLLRRRSAPPASQIHFLELGLDRTRGSADAHGKSLRLTAKEMALFEYFMLHPRRVLSRHQIAEHVWDADFSTESNVIDVLIGRLRRKISQAGGRRLIQTVQGLGYVLREPQEEAA